MGDLPLSKLSIHNGNFKTTMEEQWKSILAIQNQEPEEDFLNLVLGS